MNDRDVAAITRSVIVSRGLPLALSAVTASASGWDIRLQARIGGGTVSVQVPDGRPVTVRIAIQQRLEEL